MEYWAHIKPGQEESPLTHPLDEHLLEVGRLAAAFSTPWGGSSWALIAGLWHDLGKYQAEFQAYIRSENGIEAHIESTPGRVKHAIVGAVHAIDALRPKYGQLIAYLIAGHHAGLPDWLPDQAAGSPLSQELEAGRSLLERARLSPIPDEILNPHTELAPPQQLKTTGLHLWLRMVFSCLVDADFLDTEAFMDESRTAMRGGYPGIDQLANRYDQFMAKAFSSCEGSVNRLRAEIREACLRNAEASPGLFTLAVPTGGGKTLASLGFALHHAKRHGLKRVIYVIPYTSIIEQTADIFRNVFAGIAPSPVIEHHSNLEAENESAKSRLACENWDAPIVVTTNVQFFESLYAARPSRCRKLHNIAESVVVLDEAQLLPSEHLGPILDSLRQLTSRYRTSLVLSTATQPELTKTRRDNFGRTLLEGLGEARELAPDPARLNRELKRVQIHLPPSNQTRRDWPDLAAELAAFEQVLCIVNRRNDAETLWRLFPHDEATIHLSARMCGAHRAAVISLIRQRLKDKLPTRVISTQLVEAGVDLDFPVVYRAMAGLDSIAQAAGRCNREGRLKEAGNVVVFHPPKPSPRGLLLKAEQAATNILAGSSGEPLTPANFSRYFDAFYADVNSYDKEGVMELLTRDAANAQIQFRTAAEKFRLIPDEGQRPVFVQWGEGVDLIERLKKDGPHRDLMRSLQRHTVSLHKNQWQVLLASGDLELHQSFMIQNSSTLYHEHLGLLPEVPDYEPSTLFA